MHNDPFAEDYKEYADWNFFTVMFGGENEWERMLLKEDLSARNAVLLQRHIRSPVEEQVKVIVKICGVLFAKTNIISFSWASMSNTCFSFGKLVKRFNYCHSTNLFIV